MKRLTCLIVAAALPLLGVAQEAKPVPAPAKDVVISTYRITVKPGHEEAFKTALGAHAQKYHKGDWAWRVGDVISGPNGGVYQVVEGPFTWTALDGRADLGPEHMKDYDTNITPHVEKVTPDSYATFEEELSTAAPTRWSSKVIIVHYTAKPGKGWLLVDVLKLMKQINAKRQLSTAVWSSAFSGCNTYSLVYRTKDGWKDLDTEIATSRKLADEIAGPNGYARLQANLAESCESITEEMVEFKPELSSK